MNADEHAADLLKDGFVEVREFKGITVGARVRLRSQLWREAISRGTGNIERIFHKPNSSWELSYGRPDVELIVKRDKPQLESQHAFVADYHVEVVELAA